MVRHIAHYPIRLRGTFCGSLAHADPAAEWGVVATTLDGELVAVSARGERRLAARDFFQGAVETALLPDELRVGANGKPPLHSRFQKGRSGNPEGGRRHRRDGAKRLPALLEEVLDRRPASARGRVRRPATRREAILTALVDKSIAGDLRALKLLLDLMQKTELARARF